MKALLGLMLLTASTSAFAEPGVSSVAVVVLKAEVFSLTGDDTGFDRQDDVKVSFQSKGNPNIDKLTRNGVAYWNFGTTNEPWDQVCVKLDRKASYCAAVTLKKGAITLGQPFWVANAKTKLLPKLPTCSFQNVNGYPGVDNIEKFDVQNVLVVACHEVK
jgi:hypothetical protein